MSMTPAARGVFGIIFGVACIAIAVYFARTEGSIYLFPCLAGPCAIPISIATLALPVEKLYRPTEVNGRLVYDTGGTKMTPLGYGLLALGLAGGGLLFLALNGGF
jgi:hypothetical protein